MAPSRWVIIVSPVSGKRQGVKIVEQELLPELQKLGVKAEMVITQRARHAVEVAGKYGNADVGLVAVGGDGTVSEVIQGLSEVGKLGETCVGVLSFGSLNFYGHCAGLPMQPKDLAQYSKFWFWFTIDSIQFNRTKKEKKNN
jgi:diacylglycerol kinase family enzyme